MTAIIISALVVYNIFLTLRIREVEDYINYETQNLEFTIINNNKKLYNKMMEWRKEMKDEKPRRRSTKSSSKVSKAKVSKS